VISHAPFVDALVSQYTSKATEDASERWVVPEPCAVSCVKFEDKRRKALMVVL
jgi:hypothetical protein